MTPHLPNRTPVPILWTTTSRFIWNIAESLRGPFKSSEYGLVVLPFTVLRRLDAVLAATKDDVARAAPTLEGLPDMVRHIELTKAAGQQFYNTSPSDFAMLVADPAGLRENFGAYLAGYCPNPSRGHLAHGATAP